MIFGIAVVHDLYDIWRKGIIIWCEITSGAAVVKYGEEEEDVVYAGQHDQQMVEGICYLHLCYKILVWDKDKHKDKHKDRDKVYAGQHDQQLVEGICYLHLRYKILVWGKDKEKYKDKDKDRDKDKFCAGQRTEQIFEGICHLLLSDFCVTCVHVYM